MVRGLNRCVFLIAAVLALTPRALLAQGDQATIALPATSLTFSATYIAHDLGFWEKEGLKVKLVLVSGIGAANAVLAGSVEFSSSSGPTLIRANARGQKLFAIANTIEKPMVEVVLGREVAEKLGLSEKSPLEKKASALRGLRMAVDSVNSVVHGYLKYVARKGGVDPEREITVTPMAPPNMLAALKSGAIDGFTMSLPWPLIPVQDGRAMRLVSSPRGDLPELNPFAYNVVITRQDFCDNKPNVCRVLVSGYRRGLAHLREHPKESLGVLLGRFDKMDPKVLTEAFELIRASSLTTGKIDEEGLSKAQEFMLAQGMIKAEESLKSFASIYTNKFTQ
jgi:NitT/TauT family transport system substrate-binding protein